MQHEGLEMGDLQTDRERERETHTHKTARKTGQTDNPSEERRRRGGEEAAGWREMVVGVEEVGSCLVAQVCLPSSISL